VSQITAPSATSNTRSAARKPLAVTCAIITANQINPVATCSPWQIRAPKAAAKSEPRERYR
jgi:hypothetical protein